MRRAFLTTLLLLAATLLLSSGPASAQVPYLPTQDARVIINLEVNESYVEIPFAGSVNIGLVVQDLSFEPTTPGGPEVSKRTHAANFQARILTPNATGWGIGFYPGATSTKSGESVFGGLNIAALASAKPAVIDIALEYEHEQYANSSMMKNVEYVRARILPNYVFDLKADGRTSVQSAGQFENVFFDFTVQNLALYPDAVDLTVKAPEGYIVYIPSRVYLDPGETRTVTLMVTTPKDKVWELSRTDAFMVTGRSVNNPAYTFSAFSIVKVSGPYIPSKWIPLATLGLFCVALVVTRTRETRERRVQEKGGPRRPRVTPRQQVMLKELKRTNPEAFKAQTARLAALYAARKGAYKQFRKERLAEEREMREQSARELAEEKKRRAERARIEERLNKERARLEKLKAQELARIERAQRKEQAIEDKKRKAEEKKRAKVEAKERKRLQKVLLKKQKVLLKERAKAAKLAQKQAAKDAKAAAKAAKAAAKAAKKNKK